VNHERQAADPASLLSAYRDLIRLRGTQPELADGTVARLEASRRDVAVTLRHSPAGAAVVIQNLGPDAAPDLALTLDDGTLCGSPRASIAYRSVGAPGDGAGETVEPPRVTPRGGLDGWVPLPGIPARSTVVIDLSP
jgi:hypothetical protein